MSIFFESFSEMFQYFSNFLYQFFFGKIFFGSTEFLNKEIVFVFFFTLAGAPSKDEKKQKNRAPAKANTKDQTF